MPEYEITLADIKAYLSELEPYAEAGVIENPIQCLVARALRKKYAKTFHVNSDVFGGHASTGWLEVPQEIQSIIAKFDRIGPIHASITRQQVEDNIAELKGE